MNYSYDAESDALYVAVDPGPVDHTEELTDGVVVDVGPTGCLVGIDVMVPSSGWDPRVVVERFALAPADADFLDGLAAQEHFRPTMPVAPSAASAVGAAELQQEPCPVPASA